MVKMVCPWRIIDRKKETRFCDGPCDFKYGNERRHMEVTFKQRREVWETELGYLRMGYS